MNLETFEKLRRYPTTSWACWSQNEDCSVDFFRRQLYKLHGRAAIVGLNRSEAWTGTQKGDRMPNFHTAAHQGDRRLKRHIQDAKLGNLIGCFMTDVSDEIRTDSGAVKVDPAEAVRELVRKVTSIDAWPSRFVICLGDRAFDTVREGLGASDGSQATLPDLKMRVFESTVGNESWHIYRVWHSGNYGKFIHKSEVELPLQLQYVDSEIIRVHTG